MESIAIDGSGNGGNWYYDSNIEEGKIEVDGLEIQFVVELAEFSNRFGD